ncbi:N-acetylglucosaminyl deacetylase, LmbE family [Granulicella rosea]|uniref:N-acetylglucosaminyl deacetylase, LmbE family n=1 Tax=Granulicella rosea TaxID=474952 RepID=A0A239GZ39_9BACT|nr:PIG-L family deacetylase [Granulicella rosea]SNS74479.1 N-acetylglucosaminyl deacetylase, LmbE family [Granulicella rosea]
MANSGSSPRLVTALALSLLLADTLPGAGQNPARNQNPTPQQTDPANLAADRVKANPIADPIPENTGAIALATSLRRLATRASMMMIVAHPDDEDGGMLTYESRGKGVRVAMLTLNRGEGGQNVMSADFYDALGLDRTQELLAADRYMGVDQMFGSVVDFGFSKTKEETLAKWGHDRVLYDAVRAVRLYRPLVLASVFVGGVTDGHGHHQVAGQIDQEVFNAAGDPKVFPEMKLPPWTPLKVYARIPFARIDDKGMFDYATNQYAPTKFYNYVSGVTTTTVPKANVVVPEGDADPLLGMSYLQFARKGLSMQRSQMGGMMRPPSAGVHDVEYHRYGSHLGQPDGEISGKETGFFDGIDTSLAGIASYVTSSPTEKAALQTELKKIQALVDQAQATFTPAEPEKIAPFLRDGFIAVTDLTDHVRASNITPVEKELVLHDLRVKHTQFNDALVQALSLTLTVGPACGQEMTAQPLAPGEKLPLAIGLKHNEETQLDSVGLTVESADGTALSSDSATPSCKDQVTVVVPSDAKPTRPYFFRPGIEQPYYDIAAPALRDSPITPYPLVAVARFRYDGVDLIMRQVVRGSNGPLVVVPPVSVSVSPGAGIIPLTEKTLSLTTHVRIDGLGQNGTGQTKGTLKLELPSGWTSSPETVALDSAQRGAERDVTFTVTPAKLVPGTEYTLTAVAEVDGHKYREGYRTAGYPGLQGTNLYRPATYRAYGVDVKIAPDLKVGYLPGTGDDVPATLENLGVHAKMLTVADLTADNLKNFDAVVLGVRPYEAHPDLAAASPALLAYAQAGGVVIAQYAYREFPSGVTPYPLSLGDNEKVVEETAPVKILEPDAALLNWPNKIGSKDFDGWVEERGHGFMASWDPHFTPLLETHDAGQAPQKGGLLIAETGKGKYIYTSLALYRQLPEGVPGGYRLFANLLSLGKAPAAK